MVIVGHDVGPEGRSIQVPVSQDRSKALRDALLTNATGLRRPEYLPKPFSEEQVERCLRRLVDPSGTASPP